MNIDLNANENLDDLQRDGLKIIQRSDFFKFGIDAVLLAYFTKAKSPKRVLDIGTGSGILPLLLSSQYPNAHLTGVELQPDVADMARRSMIYNNLTHRIDILCGDINMLKTTMQKTSFDVIVSNPPYFKSGAGMGSPNDYKHLSRHEIALTLGQLLDAVHALLIPKGEFYLIHRPDRLVDIFYEARKRTLEPKLVQFVQPSEGKAPNLVLIKCIKDGGKELKYLPALNVYGADGNYTDAIHDIYNQAHLTAFNESE